jgi:CheY-like chemotaxis protein
MDQLRAVVADDDPELLAIVASTVEHFGARVTTAVSGDDLLEKLANEGPFDFIVTDVAMPWMTGLQVLHSTQTAGHAIPVVVITALRDPKVFAQAASLGDHAILLLKPFTQEQLYTALQTVLKDLDGKLTSPRIAERA